MKENLRLYPRCDKKQETLMLDTGNMSKNGPRNKPTSNLSKKLNNLSHHPHPLPDPLLNLILLILKLQMLKPDPLWLNRQNWQVNSTRRENLLPKSVKIIFLKIFVCIVVELAIKLVTALLPKRLNQKLWLLLSLAPNQRIWPQSRKKAEQSTVTTSLSWTA